MWDSEERTHWWFSGRILASHAGDPGSIPGQCSPADVFFPGPKTFQVSRVAARPKSRKMRSEILRAFILEQETIRSCGVLANMD